MCLCVRRLFALQTSRNCAGEDFYLMTNLAFGSHKIIFLKRLTELTD